MGVPWVVTVAASRKMCRRSFIITCCRPVARSISCLVDRDQLERELALLRGQTPRHSDDGRCRTCSAGDLCCEQVRCAHAAGD